MYGEDRVVFGSDYPMWDPGTELERFMGLMLTESLKDKILSKNLITLLGI
jgi:predicted TIM-barrel fold metal-dependent hydrolase